ncbi:lasso peptide biosynthesis B2 protein [Brevundimonas sp.]|uniref:lasso peptide biosynthesis B2 protein n=1 Tax=Brevundimonas sp. TaxID=1871086 RepID=UPI0028A9854E|nr:lasso peptide biosynthesis B2 protein [Brevundimonas sp.]
MSSDQIVFLAPHIHLARCHDDIVVLDVRADAYALLTDAGPLIRTGAHPDRIMVDADTGEELLALGLLASEPDPSRTPIPALVGEIPAVDDSIPRRRLVAAAFDSVLASADFAQRPFADLIAAASRRKASKRPHPDRAIAEAAGAFLAVHPWIPFEGDCLQRGYRLHDHLHRSGVAARWVFGVRTWPFLAHCWVQVGDRVVGDTRERVSGFTPILAV